MVEHSQALNEVEGGCDGLWDAKVAGIGVVGTRSCIWLEGVEFWRG